MANLVLLLGGELAARWLHLPDRMNGFPRRLILATDDPDLPYHLRPGVETTARGMHVRINQHGLRGPATPLEPPAGVHRVLVVGGSTTFGEGLAEPESLPEQLERELAARDGEPYEVLNGGVEGYNTTAELAFLRQRGLRLSPETVVVAFSLDDFQDSPVMGPNGILTRDVGARVPTCSLANASALYLSAYWFVKTGFRIPWRDLSAQRPRIGPDFEQADRQLARNNRRRYHRRPDAQWEAMVEALDGFAHLARERGLRLVVAIIPDREQVTAAEPDLVPQQKVLAICAEAGLDCVDLRPTLAARAQGEALFLDGAHPSAAGNGVLARALAEHLARRGRSG